MTTFQVHSNFPTSARTFQLQRNAPTAAKQCSETEENFQLRTYELKTFQLLVLSNCPFQLHVSDKLPTNDRRLTFNIKNIWPPRVQAFYSLYRMSVFFWILIGLTWLGGVISMLTEHFNMSIKDVTSVCII